MATFYFCEKCKKIVECVSGENIPFCCGQQMKELVANTVDAAKEKHVPDVSFEKGVIVVNIGSVPHPMTEEHYIQWVEVETNRGVYRHYLKPNDAPVSRFQISPDEDLITVYAYCNLHGLWSASL